MRIKGLLALGGLLLVLVDPAAAAETLRLETGGRTRSYVLHVPARLPAEKPAPLVLVFHGGSGTGAGMERLTGFSALADREGFLVAYPDGVGRNWNDGRGIESARAQREDVDDVGFVAALIDAIGRRHPVDPHRVYATGISNGGVFSHYLGARLASRIAAIAPVVGGIAEPFRPAFAPAAPVAVLILQGTADPLVPYAGGGVLQGRRGRIISTDEAVRLWVEADSAARDATVEDMPDRDPADGCTARRFVHAGGRGGTEVVLVRLEGGGHTWPGGPQYLPSSLIGRVCRDFDATALIWEFFRGHPKP